MFMFGLLMKVSPLAQSMPKSAQISPANTSVTSCKKLEVVNCVLQFKCFAFTCKFY